MKPQEKNAEGFKTHKGKYLTNDMTFTSRYTMIEYNHFIGEPR